MPRPQLSELGGGDFVLRRFESPTGIGNGNDSGDSGNGNEIVSSRTHSSDVSRGYSAESAERHDELLRQSSSVLLSRTHTPTTGIASSVSSPQLLNTGNGGLLRSAKLVSGSQFRLVTRRGAVPRPENPTGQCIHCESLEKVQRKQKETIRSLKLALARAEDAVRDMKFSHPTSNQPSVVPEETVIAPVTPIVAPRLNGDIALLADELAKVRKVLQTERTSAEQYRESTTEEISRLTNDLTNIRATKDSLEDENQSLRDELRETLEKLRAAELRLATLESKLESYEKDSQDRSSEVRERERLRRDLTNALSSLQNLETSSTRDINQLRSQLKDSLAATQTAQSAQKVAIQSAQLASQQANEMRIQRDDFQRKIDELTTALNAKNLLNESLESQLNTVIKESERYRASLEQHKLNYDRSLVDIKRLQNEMDEIKKQAKHHSDELLLQIEATKKTAEKAIASSLRLCVVAPTVNVHVNDERHRFKGKPQNDKLNEFLHEEIFKKYCFLFKQTADNSAPGGGSLETWLQRLLGQMQSSIEAHVTSAMEGSSS